MTVNETVRAALGCGDCANWDSHGAVAGYCRAHAPLPGPSVDEVAHWPETTRQDGCGQGVTKGDAAPVFTRCQDCAFWHQPQHGGGLVPQDRKDHPTRWWSQAGHCRRNAPHPASIPGHRGFWRVTNGQDGCVEGCAGRAEP